MYGLVESTVVVQTNLKRFRDLAHVRNSHVLIFISSWCCCCYCFDGEVCLECTAAQKYLNYLFKDSWSSTIYLFGIKCLLGVLLLYIYSRNRQKRVVVKHEKIQMLFARSFYVQFFSRLQIEAPRVFFLLHYYCV